jgi:uncharacterized membrane protein YedE/YeeE
VNEASSAQVLGAAGLISGLLGVVMSRSHFCTMGALSDWFNMSDFGRLRQWLAALVSAILITQIIWAIQSIHVETSFYLTPKLTWLSHLIGGLLFGFGMVLGSGCGSKTLIRLGHGSLKALVVVLVMGLAAYITMRGLLAMPRVSWIESQVIELSVAQDLPRLIFGNNATPWQRILSACGVCALLLGLMALMGKSSANNRLQVFSGLWVGGLIAAMWFVSASLGYLEEDPNTLKEGFIATNSKGPESFSFVAPIAYTIDYLMLFSDRSKTLSIGIVSVFGMVVGAFIDALLSRRFRLEGFTGLEDTGMHLLGAVLMGVGGVTAFGCTVGQGLSAASLLALSAAISLPAIALGAWLAMKWQISRL